MQSTFVSFVVELSGTPQAESGGGYHEEHEEHEGVGEKDWSCVSGVSRDVSRSENKSFNAVLQFGDVEVH